MRSRFPGVTVAACRTCGLSFLLPLPTAAEIDSSSLYEDEYFAGYARAGITLPAEARQVPRRYRRRLRQALPGGRPGRLLDVGPGHGSFLAYARDQGWHTFGVDISRHAVQLARRLYDLEIANGTLQAAAFPDDAFDLVHLSHVLEHVPDLRGTLGEVQRVLKPGGLVAIEVPNELDNLHARVRRVARRVAPPPVPSTHLYFFTPRALRRALVEAGFVRCRVRTLRDTADPLWWRRLAKRMLTIAETGPRMGPLIEGYGRKASR
ncbi:MAG: class I SAM-dependent methyltransferase [bacterium]